MLRTLSLGAALSLAWATSSFSGVCDYRLSQLHGPKTATVVVAGGGAAATVGPTAMAVGGLYFFPHAGGTLMLGSTLAGASGAGTIGIIGSSGFAASVLAVLTAPVTLIVGAGTTVTVGALEAGCYFIDERITEEEEVVAVLWQVSLTANEDYLKLLEENYREADESSAVSRIRVPAKGGGYEFFEVKNLNIVNGELRHQNGPFSYTSLGNIAAAVISNP